jgi:putative membrane protein
MSLADTRHLHPYTAVVRGLSRAVGLGSLATIATAFNDGFTALGANAGFIVTLALLGIGYEFLYYRRYEYALTENTFDIDSGVVSRREREIPLRRIQNIDISQNAFQRLLGLAVLRIETAGGGETEADLRYVSPAEAQRLQQALTERKARREGRDPALAVDADGEETGRKVYEITDTELGLLSALSIDPGASFVSTLLAVAAQGVIPANPEGVDSIQGRLAAYTPMDVAIALGIVAVVAWLVSVAVVYSRYANFTLYRVDDELRYERGLVGRYSGTIPLEKVQTVTLVANPLKRRLGYTTVSVETAGYAPSGDQRRAAETAIPFAKHDRAMAFVRTLEEFDVDTVAGTRPPKRARERYAVRFALLAFGVAALAYGVDRWITDLAYWYVPLAGVLLAPLAAHLRWANRGYHEDGSHFVAHTGFWRHKTRIVPVHRIQTVVDVRTIFQRRRRLASVTADTASTASVLGGDATAFDVDADTAADLRERLGDRLQASLTERRRRRAVATRLRRATERAREVVDAVDPTPNRHPDAPPDDDETRQSS